MSFNSPSPKSSQFVGIQPDKYTLANREEPKDPPDPKSLEKEENNKKQIFLPQHIIFKFFIF